MSSAHIYDNGLPFDSKLAENIDDGIHRIKAMKASCIIIDGGLGEGKTTLGVEIGDYINKKFGMSEVSLTEKEHPQLGMGGADFTKKIRICYEKKLVVAIYDESGDFNKRGSLSQFNAMLNRIFETFRAFQILVIIIMPSFQVLDNQLFDNKIPRLLLHLRDRIDKSEAKDGIGYGNYYGYSGYRMAYLKYWMTKLKFKSDAYNIVEPNFWGHFKDLTPERSKQLDSLSTRNKLSILRKSEIKMEGLMSYAELSHALMRSIIWVKQAVSQLKIKETRTISRAKYFDEQALNRLAEHLDSSSDRRRNVQ